MVHTTSFATNPEVNYRQKKDSKWYLHRWDYDHFPAIVLEKGRGRYILEDDLEDDLEQEKV